MSRLLAALALAALLGGGSASARPAARDDGSGNASSGLTTAPPTDAVEAAFDRRSYVAGSTAKLRLRGRGSDLRVEIFRAGAGSDGPLDGAPVTDADPLAQPGASVPVRVGNWPSGLYYARVETPGRGTWYAPFVVRPRRLGTARVAVVLPTNTWQAYNFEDDDSWYANAAVHTVDLARPFVDAGVPPHYEGYDRGFIRWLASSGAQADFLSDDDLDRVASGDVLAWAYDLIVFPGHEEYVTRHEFDVTERFRDLGGNLAFLSANDFFYEVTKDGDEMHGRTRWRDIGRPEAALVGAQYVDWNHDRYRNLAYRVVDTSAAPWLFRGTSLRDGGRFGTYGIEVDAVAAASPAQTKVLAEIPGIFGPGVDAEMTYYATPSGAKVFSAGVINFGGSALWPQVRTMVGNLWSYLGRP
jgi:hypothetical protein